MTGVPCAVRRLLTVGYPPHGGKPTPPHKEVAMLRYAVVFFIIALIAAVLGFGGIAAGAASIAKILFMIFVVLFVVSLIWGLVAGRG